jgi:predicted Zn-dependent peptidase
LAYSVTSRYSAPSILERSYYNFAYIGTQSDKLPEAVEGMMELLKVFPMSEKGYAQAKEGAMQQIQTDRITKGDILNTYHRNKKLGVNVDARKVIYDALPSITLNDLKSFHEQYLKNLTYQFMVLGNKEKLNLDSMKKYGVINTLELKDVFGY